MTGGGDEYGVTSLDHNNIIEQQNILREESQGPRPRTGFMAQHLPGSS